ncbi:hypothetical protein L914_17501 [Phytophthora nicotianae]|uniref:Uncharacterized protein n=1 Tax=Phytophthora nicotianae TaxID=4792 RepID=W2MH07_PHYNI|nr:hypothetical protein L914_17501 [Phytophthora nicotianae]
MWKFLNPSITQREQLYSTQLETYRTVFQSAGVLGAGRRTRALEGAYGRAVARRISSQGTIVVKRLGNLENVRRMEMDQSAARGRLLQVHNQNILIRTIILETPSFWSRLDRQGAIIAILDRRSSPIWCYHFDNPGSKW